MNLKEYLEKNRITPMAFAMKVGISLRSVYRIISGKRPLFSTACKIEDATNKNVTVEELRNLDDKKKIT